MITPRSSDRELLDVVGHKLPLVLIDAYPELPSTPCVRSTNWHGAREATNYLIELGLVVLPLLLGGVATILLRP